jgi:hypothetical protein
VRCQTFYRFALEKNFTAIRLKVTRYNIEQGRFSGTVGAYQSGDRSLPDLQRAIINGFQATKAFFHALYFKHLGTFVLIQALMKYVFKVKG